MPNHVHRQRRRRAGHLAAALIGCGLLLGLGLTASAGAQVLDCAEEPDRQECLVQVTVTKSVIGVPRETGEQAVDGPMFPFSVASTGAQDPVPLGPLGAGSEPETVWIAPGTVTVSEELLDGYLALYSSCFRQGDNAWVNPETPGSVSFDGKSGDKWDCYFDNGKVPTLTVRKSVEGAAPEDATPFEFTLTTLMSGPKDASFPGAEASPGPQAFTLTNGASTVRDLEVRYDTIVEELAPPAGYAFRSVSCTRSDPRRRGSSEFDEFVGLTYDGPAVRIIRPDWGTEVDCLYTNVKLPRLTVAKALTNGAGAGLTTPFPFSVTGQPAFSLTGGQSDGPRVLPVGVYTVTEGTLPAGFTFTGVACSEPSPVNGQSVEVNLAAGDDVTCTFTNDQTPPPAVVTLVLRPRLAIVKTGPLRARGLQRLTYAIRVRNRGSGVARNVVVTDVLPAGLSYVTASRRATVRGRTVSVAMGNLQPGASRAVRVTVRAAADVRGRRVNVAVARATGARPVRDSAPTMFAPLVRRIIPAVTG